MQPSPEQQVNNTHHFFILKELFLFCILLLGSIYSYTAYTQFADANLTFDDDRVFTDLGKINSSEDIWNFILDNKEIGQLGRPVSLASFLLNTGDWPNNLAGFRRINILLHILNAFILTLVSIRIARIIPSLEKHAASFAVVLSLIWLLHPFLASTSFHVIQRMTLLSGTFSLLCFLGYLHGRSFFPNKPIHSLIWMSLGIIVPGLAGILSKENAALTPLLIAALELTILSYYKPITHPLFRYWKLLFFAGPALLLALYAIYYLIFSAADGYFLRPFTITERLFSESVILFDYIRQIIVPDISKMGPFQDDTSYIRGAGVMTILASFLWISLITTAWHFRKRFPAYAFVILFFITGHLLESTFFNLELYFDHRNYLPSLSILGVLIASAWIPSAKWPKALISLYILLLSGLLWSLTSLWGHPILAPIAWAEAHPTSTRATQVLTTMFWNLGDVEKARETIISAYNRNPADSNLAVGALVYQCFNDVDSTSKELINKITRSAPSLNYGRTIATPLHSMYTLMSQKKCMGLQPEQGIAFTQGLLSNPLFINKEQRFAFNLLISRFAELDANRRLFVTARADAYKIKPWTGGANSIYCEFFSQNRLHEALTFLQEINTDNTKSNKPIIRPEHIQCSSASE